MHFDQLAAIKHDALFISTQRKHNRLNGVQCVALPLTGTVQSVCSVQLAPPLIGQRLHLALIVPSMFPGGCWTQTGPSEAPFQHKPY